MHRDDDARRQRRPVERFAAARGDRHRAAEDGLRRRRAHAHDDVRLHRGELRLEPAVTRTDLDEIRLRMQAPLAARLPLEVLHRVRDVHVFARDPRRLERRVEDPPGGTDERVPLLIFLVARLLADEHERGARRALAEHGLCGVLVKSARRAATRGARELGRIVRTGRHERERRRRLRLFRPRRHARIGSKTRARAKTAPLAGGDLSSALRSGSAAARAGRA